MFVLRYGLGTDDHRLLIVNLGADADLPVVPEPLLAPPAGCDWRVAWCSEAVRYGGTGRAQTVPAGGWHFVGESATPAAAPGALERTRVGA